MCQPLANYSCFFDGKPDGRNLGLRSAGMFTVRMGAACTGMGLPGCTQVGPREFKM